jgi:hypothetical protein
MLALSLSLGLLLHLSLSLLSLLTLHPFISTSFPCSFFKDGKPSVTPTMFMNTR